MNIRFLIVFLISFYFVSCSKNNNSDSKTRKVIILNKEWKFQRGEHPEAIQLNFDDSSWQDVNIPHDWAIYGPFDKEIDKQFVAISQNNESIATVKTGRTGALPYIGEAWYRHKFNLDKLDKDQKVLLQFEGAMSEPEVFINGKKVGEWKYGYAYFYFDITDFITLNENLLTVKLSNKEKSSRWYPGAGLYRKVSLIIKNNASIDHWGSFITTPMVSKDLAKVSVQTNISATNALLKTTIYNSNGEKVGTNSIKVDSSIVYQTIDIKNPKLWHPESPYLYNAESKLYINNVLKDSTNTTFGIRSIEYVPHEGLKLNGEFTKFKGVCLHHDLGPLGSAVNKYAIERRLKILKDMGANAIRSSHNMPSFEILQLADEMGFMFLAESFDEWKKPKVENGYNLYFDEYAEKDIVNLVRATRNHPSIVLWSSGNEVPDQWGDDGVERAQFLQDIFHREDPTRPVTVGMDQVEAVIENGFGAVMDIPGLNYRTHLYHKAYERFPQGFILGSETASTVSSRGVYKFPVEKYSMKKYEDGHSSSYDLEYCSWSNVPDEDFVLQDDYNWVLGEFVWTGFDYLGEPTPYDEYWPSRSSYFGINDLAGLPKDRFYLYRSRWNKKENTLHILPHWNWEGREGQQIPVFVYTNYDSAELFVNGKSHGIQKKNNDSPQNRYRLMWEDVIYQPGELKVTAYDASGYPVEDKKTITAGKPSKIILDSNKTILNADGEDLAFIEVSVVDINGNPCPTATNLLKFEVEGLASFIAVCNGDPTSLSMFHIPEMKLFSGKLVVIVQASKNKGISTLKVTGANLIENSIEFKIE